ncbi:hypothetical protein SJA_C1-20190 [Sphingobium indicum UT26S]|uniref:Uncharacterized protein n=1 Tax=Sphingobium indicum (strain DSM 16413 / CCM 7287 / MTCC 6362 / UT26 / NBRC 101211 / UT26S) TaxID=452662 RepID=D4Z2M1_SPHIU|nr:hypothetical protein SJA_C1-20190 [Sphingobium indicum UT26S]
MSLIAPPGLAGRHRTTIRQTATQSARPTMASIRIGAAAHAFALHSRNGFGRAFGLGPDTLPLAGADSCFCLTPRFPTRDARVWPMREPCGRARRGEFSDRV